MSFLRTLLSRLTAFRRDTRGSVTAEFVVILPILFWAYGASYVFFDAYRQQSVNLKAAFTVGDLISRETQPINAAYIDSMYELTKLLTRNNAPLALRISVIRWDEEDDKYYLDWSQNRGWVSPINNSMLEDLAERLPVMPDEERVILVETWNSWKAPFPVGLSDQSLDNFIFTRPRFAPQVKWSNG
jgi:hypothetical protein